MIAAIEQTTWDLIAQIGLWFIFLPALVVGLLVYIAIQITVERRENQRYAGKWGLAAQSKSDTE